MGLRNYKSFNSFSAGIVFICQNLTYKDDPHAMKGLKFVPNLHTYHSDEFIVSDQKLTNVLSRAFASTFMRKQMNMPTLT